MHEARIQLLLDIYMHLRNTRYVCLVEAAARTQEVNLGRVKVSFRRVKVAVKMVCSSPSPGISVRVGVVAGYMYLGRW